MSERKAHKWYHDVMTSNWGRLCLTCRFREHRDAIANEPCLGSRRLYDAACKDGENYGRAAEQERLRTMLGLTRRNAYKP